MSASKRRVLRAVPRIRVLRGQDIALGPGKAELLEWIGRTGSIREAALHLKMSYMRAWSLIRTMEGCFRQPLVRTARGGRRGGGAGLTAAGESVVDRYRRMEARAAEAWEEEWRELRKLLKG